MNEDDMKEIAAILNLVLANTTPNSIESGKNAGQPSKAKYTIEPAAQIEASDRVKALLDRYPVYPELDLELLQRHFG